MPILNYTSREITVKIVYYGPALSGKTTNVKYISTILPEDKRGKMVTLPTKEDRTLFFDFLPFSLGGKAGYKIRLQLYTVPGQVIYDSTRRLVLQGADGVVFVADSQKPLLENNIESLQNMKANLKRNGLNYQKIPLVLQYNKRDLPNILSMEKLDSVLNELGRPSVPSIAIRGEGVVETLVKITELTLKDLQGRYSVLEDMNIVSLLNELKSLERVEEIPEEEVLPESGELPEEEPFGEQEEQRDIISIFSPDEETGKMDKKEVEEILELEEADVLSESSFEEAISEEGKEMLEEEIPEKLPEEIPDFLESPPRMRQEKPTEAEGEILQVVKEIPLQINIKDGEEVELILKFRIKVKKSGDK